MIEGGPEALLGQLDQVKQSGPALGKLPGLHVPIVLPVLLVDTPKVPEPPGNVAVSLLTHQGIQNLAAGLVGHLCTPLLVKLGPQIVQLVPGSVGAAIRLGQLGLGLPELLLLTRNRLLELRLVLDKLLLALDSGVEILQPVPLLYACTPRARWSPAPARRPPH